MSKRELIDRIRLFNSTATSSFLAKFGEGDLSLYLQHLEETTPPLRLASLRMSAQAAAVAEGDADPRQLALAF